MSICAPSPASVIEGSLAWNLSYIIVINYTTSDLQFCFSVLPYTLLKLGVHEQKNDTLHF